MNMKKAILLTLEDSGPASFVDILGAAYLVSEDFSAEVLPGVLQQLVRTNIVRVQAGVYQIV